MHADLVGDAATLDVRVFVLVKLSAELVDALVFVENLQFFELGVALLEIQAFLRVLLDEPLTFLLDLDFRQSLLLSLCKFLLDAVLLPSLLLCHLLYLFFESFLVLHGHVQFLGVFLLHHGGLLALASLVLLKCLLASGYFL